MEHLALFCLACGTGCLLVVLVFFPLWACEKEETQRAAPAPASEGHLIRR